MAKLERKSQKKKDYLSMVKNIKHICRILWLQNTNALKPN